MNSKHKNYKLWLIQNTQNRHPKRNLRQLVSNFPLGVVKKGDFIMENQHVNERNITLAEKMKTTERRDLDTKLDAVGWGMFFIWIGMVFLTDIDAGVGLLGVGIITLGEQAIRKFFNLKLEGFWVVIGILFAVGGLWELFNVQLPLGPILLIVAGLALLVSIVKGKHLMEQC